MQNSSSLHDVKLRIERKATPSINVNNTLYFRYFEIIRIEWLHGVAGPPDLNGEGFVVANAFCNFLRQLEYPGELLAKQYVTNPGRSSFDTYVTLERSDAPGVLHATGGATVVWVNIPQGKSVPLPKQLRELLT